MPWLTIFITILTFFLAGGQKKENRTRALVAAGLAGAGSYYVTHDTDWGSRNLGEFDGVVPPITGGDIKNPADPQGPKIPAPTGQGSSLWSVLQSWGPGGTAAVVGTGAAVATNNWLPLILLGVAAVVILK